MEVNQEKKVELEEVAGDADVGGGMETRDECEREEVVEEAEVYPIPSRKTEPLYKTHEKQFLVFCPAEIWTMILEQLKNDPDAQTNCANASPYLWELLKKDRVLFLFPAVVKVIAPKATEREFGMLLKETGENYKEEEDYFWTREEGKDWRASVLECRLVCSAWNKAVEQCYESNAMAGRSELLAENDMDPRSPVKRMGKRWTEGLFQFDSVSNIQHFLNEFEFLHFSNPVVNGPPKNPFLGRWISIDVAREEHYITGMSRLLTLFGNEVWYCMMSWHTRPTAKKFSSAFFKWLGLMPNLQLLAMEGPFNLKGLSRKVFQGNRVPKLEKLEVLEMVDTSGLLVSEVLRVNCHVKVLRMRDIDSEVDLEVGQLLCNLKSIQSMGSKSGHKMLEECGHHWKHLSLLCLEDDGSKYFGKLEKNWAQTLTELKLSDPFGMNKATILKKSKNLRLKLPRIRRLSLKITGLFYLDFMESMQGSLEHLEIVGINFRDGYTIGDRNKVKKEQRIELLGFEEKMDKSNIWNVFGKLETIKISNFGKGTEFIFSKDRKKYLCVPERDVFEEYREIFEIFNVV